MQDKHKTKQRLIEELTELRSSRETLLQQIDGLLSGRVAGHPSYDELHQQPYGDLSDLNANRLLLDSVGRDLLADVVSDYLDVLETSAAVYERNGDYALGIFSSGWCRFLDAASRQRCDTRDNEIALQSGRWHCHESCWTGASRVAIETGQPVDVECMGGLRLYAVPIHAGSEVVGAINFGYGDPPKDLQRLQHIAQLYDVTVAELRHYAAHYQSRPDFTIDLAKRRLMNNARLIGEICMRKQTEDALREADKRLQHSINSMPLAFMLWDAQFRATDWNRKAESIFGYSKEEMLGKSVLTVVPAEVQHLVAGLMDDFREGKSVHYSERNNNVRKDGSLISCQWYNTPLMDERGELTAILSMAEDVTQRLEAEESLKESEARYRDLVNHTTDVVWRLNAQGVFTFVNPSIKAMTGYEPEEVIGFSFEHAFTEDRHKKASELLRRALRGEWGSDDIVFELTHLHKDGSERIGEVRAVATRDEHGEVIGIQGTTRDITERKRIDVEFQKMEKLQSIGVLAGGIAHDLNNLLTGIVGHLSLAKMSTSLKEKDTRLDRAADAAMRVKDLTQQLLTFARGGSPVTRPEDIHDLVTNAAGFALRGSNVSWECSNQDNLWPVEVDEGQINQVINNLIINAQQVMPQGGTVTIDISNTSLQSDSHIPLQSGRYVKISIADQGTGIAADNLNKIFDPFFSTKPDGNGLGLATSHSIIQKHKGHIAVQSEVGVGTRFDIYLPAAAAKVRDRTVEEVEIVKGDGIVLVMEDEEHVRELFAVMLEKLGYRIVVSTDGGDAIGKYRDAQASGNVFAAVILDLTIPGGMGGKATLQQLKEIDPSVKAIVTSGYSNDPILAHFQDYGFEGFIAKPFRLRELSAVLHEVIVGS